MYKDLDQFVLNGLQRVLACLAYCLKRQQPNYSITSIKFFFNHLSTLLVSVGLLLILCPYFRQWHLLHAIFLEQESHKVIVEL